MYYRISLYGGHIALEKTTKETDVLFEVSKKGCGGGDSVNVTLSKNECRELYAALKAILENGNSW